MKWDTVNQKSWLSDLRTGVKFQSRRWEYKAMNAHQYVSKNGTIKWPKIVLSVTIFSLNMLDATRYYSRPFLYRKSTRSYPESSTNPQKIAEDNIFWTLLGQKIVLSDVPHGWRKSANRGGAITGSACLSRPGRGGRVLKFLVVLVVTGFWFADHKRCYGISNEAATGGLRLRDIPLTSFRRGEFQL